MTRAQQREFHKSFITQDLEDYLNNKLNELCKFKSVNDSIKYSFYIRLWRYTIFIQKCRNCFIDHDPAFNFYAAQVKQAKKQLKKSCDQLYLNMGYN